MWDAQEEDEQDIEATKLGSIVLSTIKAKRFARKKGLMFANIVVSGKTVEALVDIRALDLFVVQGAAKKLGLKPNKGVSFMKMMNSKEVPTMGSTIIDVQLGAQKGKQPIEVIPMDDYDCVIGIGFLDRINALLVLLANCICVLDTQRQCVVPIKKGHNPDAKLLSTMKLAKGAWQNEETFASIHKLKDTLKALMKASIEVLEVLDEFKDVMLVSIPSRLPLQMEVDHHIEVVPRGQPLARALYRMSHLELAELRKQLRELVDAGFIRPSKSPYGALVLF
ncbi:Uncharacterized protein TCM_010900 [Theobroma cacao]|uniref:Uncharacterized protein n=1 Tax=Theobroma cacao TaxID=3641 RepID=A0A061EFD2_THECC|nr:Uncharacterized protein TCM_010900 [Theobroma cacao]